MITNDTIEARIREIAAQQHIHTVMEYNTATEQWRVTIDLLDPQAPSQTIDNSSATADTLEVALTLAAQALAAKESENEQQQFPRPNHTPGGNYAWAYQLVGQSHRQ